jgi:hypothetical protein
LPAGFRASVTREARRFEYRLDVALELDGPSRRLRGQTRGRGEQGQRARAMHK